MNRREFLGTLTAGAALASTMPTALAGAKKARPEGFMWASLLHVGMNMWGDWDGTMFEASENQFVKGAGTGQSDDDPMDGSGKSGPQDRMRFDYETWKAVTGRMADRGLNTLLIDIGEGVKWPRHPELGAKDAWEPERFVAELNRLKSLGLRLVPKMNFSAGHDAWLKDYGHRLSTTEYYQVCADCIQDAKEMFGNPEYVHLGYEEEVGDKYQRTDDLWWKDLLFLVDKVEKGGARAWIWSDYPRTRSVEIFKRRMPKSVLLGVGWYPEIKDLLTCRDTRMHRKFMLYALYEELGYDQTPCGGNWCTDKNMAEIVRMGDAVIRDGRLKGYVTTAWRATVPKWRQKITDSIDQLGELI